MLPAGQQFPVRDVSGDVSFRGQEGGVTAVSATLRRRADSAARRQLGDGAHRVELQRIDNPAPVHVLYDLGDSARKIHAGSAQEEIEDAYQDLREKVLDKLNVDAETVTFNLSKMAVRYKVRGGALHEENLNPLLDQHPDCMEAFRALEDLVQPLWTVPLRNQPVKRGMIRSDNEVLSALPKDKYSDSAKLALTLYAAKETDPAKLDAALKRITMIERIIDKQRTAADAQITRLNGLPQPPTLATTQALDDLKALKERLEIDRLGLYVATAFAPPADPDPRQAFINAKKAAENAREVLQNCIDDAKVSKLSKVRRRLPTWMPAFIRGSAEPSMNKAYAVDAAALIFSSLTIASRAWNFWDEHGIYRKIDSLEGEFIRFIWAQDANARIPQLEAAIAKVRDATAQAALAGALATEKAAVLNTATYPPTPFQAPAQGATPEQVINAKVDQLRAGYGFAV